MNKTCVSKLSRAEDFENNDNKRHVQRYVTLARI